MQMRGIVLWMTNRSLALSGLPPVGSGDSLKFLFALYLVSAMGYTLMLNSPFLNFLEKVKHPLYQLHPEKNQTKHSQNHASGICWT
jgi:hypothetical protein